MSNFKPFGKPVDPVVFLVNMITEIALEDDKSIRLEYAEQMIKAVEAMGEKK